VTRRMHGRVSARHEFLGEATARAAKSAKMELRRATARQRAIFGQVAPRRDARDAVCAASERGEAARPRAEDTIEQPRGTEQLVAAPAKSSGGSGRRWGLAANMVSLA